MTTQRVSRRLVFALPAAAAFTARSWAAEGDFNAFLAGVRRDAAAQGIRASTIDAAFRNAQFLPRVVELDRKQPETRLTFAEYLEKVVTAQRMDGARQQAAENRVLLDGIWR